jgi:hypothetical protein
MQKFVNKKIFQELHETINRILKGKVSKELKLKCYNVMAVPTLLYGSETWTKKNTNSSKNEIVNNCRRI